ncbi:hypothetical protein MUU53_13435 [Rhizobium lemnae]|uniref:Antitoxin VbhA domain-containing protein n=1 Tax=Rhizobium lemnae TaxID=1214924 RepID=A0ABV8EH02_9HYPH|nr:hypothetical protein [Rhizobium lemnae]MCJ8508913.1 hypothetical protein [Rhizobium lemnae]
MNLDKSTLEPSDLKFLQSVFDGIRQTKGIEIRSSDASSIAAQIIELYQAGVRDPDELTQRFKAG